MAITVNTNLSALLVQSNLKQASNSSNNAMQRMSTGYKINHAKDNAAGYSIATKMSVKLSALKQAEDNASMGLDMVQTASSTLDTMSNLTSRFRALATQAQNGTNGTTSIDALNSEANAIVQELYRIKNTAVYNGINLLGGISSSVATNAITTLSRVATVSTQSASPKAGASGFIKEVQRRDTSSMTTLASVDENTTLTSGTYSISTADELAKLATMTNNGNIGANTEFVLANDIDLSAYSSGEGWTSIGNSTSNSFSGSFDGNGYTIYNLRMNRSFGGARALFGVISNGSIQNLAIEKASFVGHSAGILAFCIDNNTTISNCSVKESNITVNSSDYYTGGLIAHAISSSISDCFSDCSIAGIGSSPEDVGGLVGGAEETTIKNCYALGSVDIAAGYLVGGLVGVASDSTITNSYAVGNVVGNLFVGGLIGATIGTMMLDDVYYTDTTGQTNGIGEVWGNTPTGMVNKITMSELDELIVQGILPNYKIATTGTDIKFQIGINLSESSQISVDFFDVDISSLDGLQLGSANALSTIDKVLKDINERQTYFGSVENRLTSALDSISISYENILSSRSTLRDADVAKESSAYIRNQILLNASATLLATANQSPAIALQLIQGR